MHYGFLQAFLVLDFCFRKFFRGSGELHSQSIDVSIRMIDKIVACYKVFLLNLLLRLVNNLLVQRVLEFDIISCQIFGNKRYNAFFFSLSVLVSEAQFLFANANNFAYQGTFLFFAGF